MFKVSIMETAPHVSDKSAKKLLSDLDVEGLIKYRTELTEIQLSDITRQVKELEVKFDHGWKRFINKPCVDQYGQVWMIWENSSANPFCPKERYQIYTIPCDSDEFKYVFIDDLKTVHYPREDKTSYEFSVGFDAFGDTETINVFIGSRGFEFCHFYSNKRELDALCRKYDDKTPRKLGGVSIGSLIKVA